MYLTPLPWTSICQLSLLGHPGYNKFIFVLKVGGDAGKSGHKNYITPDGNMFLNATHYRGISAKYPTTADFIYPMLNGYTTESFDDWVHKLVGPIDSAWARKAYKKARKNSKRLRAFINDDDKLERLIEAAQDH